MKKVGLYILAAVFMAGVAGCGGATYSEADLVGTWQIDSDKNCTGKVTGRGTAHLYENGIVRSNEGYKGTWEVNGDQIAITFHVIITVTWDGTIESNDTMSGTFFGQGINTTNSGCWTGTKTSNTP